MTLVAMRSAHPLPGIERVVPSPDGAQTEPGEPQPKACATELGTTEGTIPKFRSQIDNLIHGVDGFPVTDATTCGKNLGLPLLIGRGLLFLQFGFAFEERGGQTNGLAAMAAGDTAISDLNRCGLHEILRKWILGRYPQVRIFASGRIDGTAKGARS
jgi:hypothetical protein